MSPMQMRICVNLAALEPSKIEVENESHKHRSGPGAETHFKITVVAEKFAAQNLVARHRAVYALLTQEMADGVHAIALHCFTPEEWAIKQKSAASPVCEGGE